MPPLVIVEGPAGGWQNAVAEIGAGGWRAVPGFGPPHVAGLIARTGVVRSSDDARAALLAALAGQGIVAHATADRAVIDRLADDLRRLGPVDHRLLSDAEAPKIDAELRELLGLLAEGQSLADAAAIIGLSRRTADRRLAAGRRLLGARRTTEAIARAARLGWLPKER